MDNSAEHPIIESYDVRNFNQTNESDPEAELRRIEIEEQLLTNEINQVTEVVGAL